MLWGLARRIRDVARCGSFDALLVQREAMLFGPEIFEWLISELRGLPLILDLDDATYIPYESPTFGKVGSLLKAFGKTDRLMARACTVICGNRFIAEYVTARGGRAVIIPTVVDETVFKPIEAGNSIPIIGWIGTHSTFPMLESLFPVLARVAQRHEFILRVVGSGRRDVEVEGVKVENLKWNLREEPRQFASMDIGLYPILVSPSASSEWINGKSGFKAIEYMASGVPFIMSPVGICKELGEAGKTHMNATDTESWYTSLVQLLESAYMRRSMGVAGRMHFLKNFTVSQWSHVMAKTISESVNIAV
jgi:glycosyltransferase involved in cell wall biosynthesis